MVLPVEEREGEPRERRGRPVLPEVAMVEVVRQALERSDALLGIALCSRDGLPIVDGFTARHDSVVVAAMAELIWRSGGRVFQSLGYRGPEYLVLHGADVDIVVHEVPPLATVIAVAEAGANLETVQLVLRDLAHEVTTLLG